MGIALIVRTIIFATCQCNMVIKQNEIFSHCRVASNKTPQFSSQEQTEVTDLKQTLIQWLRAVNPKGTALFICIIVNYSNELTNHQPGGWYFYAQKEGDDMACRKGKGGRKDKGK